MICSAERSSSSVSGTPLSDDLFFPLGYPGLSESQEKYNHTIVNTKYSVNLNSMNSVACFCSWYSATAQRCCCSRWLAEDPSWQQMTAKQSRVFPSFSNCSPAESGQVQTVTLLTLQRTFILQWWPWSEVCHPIWHIKLLCSDGVTPSKWPNISIRFKISDK